MSYLIIAVVIFLALAPLSHFIPSRRQRREATLREAAAVKGMFVEFRNLPGPGKGGERVSRSNIIYYGLRLRPSRGRERREGAWLRDGAGEWRAASGRRPLPGPLENMPSGVLAASADEASCGVYWREEGDEENIAQIHRALAQWAELLQA